LQAGVAQYAGTGEEAQARGLPVRDGPDPLLSRVGHEHLHVLLHIEIGRNATLQLISLRRAPAHKPRCAGAPTHTN
jgi:hypothetical protein